VARSGSHGSVDRDRAVTLVRAAPIGLNARKCLPEFRVLRELASAMARAATALAVEAF
jgi:hypothetical protein